MEIDNKRSTIKAELRSLGYRKGYNWIYPKPSDYQVRNHEIIKQEAQLLLGVADHTAP